MLDPQQALHLEFPAFSHGNADAPPTGLAGRMFSFAFSPDTVRFRLSPAVLSLRFPSPKKRD